MPLLHSQSNQTKFNNRGNEKSKQKTRIIVNNACDNQVDIHI